MPRTLRAYAQSASPPDGEVGRLVIGETGGDTLVQVETDGKRIQVATASAVSSAAASILSI